jgi:hypothetical protein
MSFRFEVYMVENDILKICFLEIRHNMKCKFLNLQNRRQVSRKPGKINASSNKIFGEPLEIIGLWFSSESMVN